MIAFRILGTILLSINLVINLLLVLATKSVEEGDGVIAKLYVLLNSVSTIFIIVLMWVL